jgi:hypothetical protein
MSETPFFLGIVLVSGLGGLVMTFLSHLFLMKVSGYSVGEELSSRGFLVTGIITGVVERFVFSLFVGFAGPAGVATAAIGWIALKGQLHYKIFTPGTVSESDPRPGCPGTGERGHAAEAGNSDEPQEQQNAANTANEKDNEKGRDADLLRVYVGLLGSLLSLTIAFAGGAIVFSGYVWDHNASVPGNIQGIIDAVGSR